MLTLINWIIPTIAAVVVTIGFIYPMTAIYTSMALIVLVGIHVVMSFHVVRRNRRIER